MGAAHLVDQPAADHEGLIERLAEIENRGEGHVLVGEPGHPVITPARGEGLREEGDQLVLLASRAIGDRDEVGPAQRVQQVFGELGFAAAEDDMASPGRAGSRLTWRPARPARPP